MARGAELRRPAETAFAAHPVALPLIGYEIAAPPPERSAARTLTTAQAIIGAALIVGALWAFIAAWPLSSAAAHVIAYAIFAVAIGLRLVAAAASLAPPPPRTARWNAPPPIYTLLCPLYMEADIAPRLVEAIRRLNYPPERLDVKLILEEDDVETIAVLEEMRLAAPFEILLAPPEAPRTKPKALNLALALARGDFVAVYDAEDRPHPDQLNAALDAFADGGEALACVQAPLLIDNGGERWISGQFAAEYAIHFRALLPFLARIGAPLPLGGTSNHFRAGALRRSGAWDPYNVTEDADLGYRLARDGWRVGMIAEPTWEEAPLGISPWLRQRTRWIKGHMQTWLVLMRTPLSAARDLGLAGFLWMQLVLLGGVLAAFAHGPLALFVALSLATPLNLLGPADLTLFVTGCAVAAYAALVAAALLREPRIAVAALTMPLYWPLATLAACRALAELVVAPHRWNKTEHGLARSRPKVFTPLQRG